MLDASSKQPSFFDTDQICKPLFPPDSFWHQFRELVYPLINDEDYECMYCPDRGRPAKSPAMLTMVTILQRRENLSDREAEDRVRYDRRRGGFRKARGPHRILHSLAQNRHHALFLVQADTTSRSSLTI